MHRGRRVHLGLVVENKELDKPAAQADRDSPDKLNKQHRVTGTGVSGRSSCRLDPSYCGLDRQDMRSR